MVVINTYLPTVQHFSLLRDTDLSRAHWMQTVLPAVRD